ncbi:MAG: PQQ-dependent sugar dehydrogenase [Pyrinomonadaceae bacterium]|nr:PQQ-dependent sugar dehydrogenase [Pyrinomonadaceae bacterium]MCX7639712.1 PQQ-dependent sugar dehydrogenase [Pyrinomonadaceae bacterium]MDW8304295.1 PQQ-dependent sugar dehydrogenase [Acidobacteriota bacterium]
MRSLSIFVSFTVFLIGVEAQQIRLQPFLSGLSSPVYITTAKDGTGRLFVVQQRGIIKVVEPGSRTISDFLNITSKVSQTGTERGLLGLAFHPQFSTNGYFFVNYTRASDGATIVSRFKAINNNTIGDPNSERIIITIPQPYSNHNGGMIDFGPDGYLYIGMGDGGSANDPQARSQNINELLGKMLRIAPSVSESPSDPPYTIPPDNPYAGPTPGADEIYAIGLRNPWRWSFDRATGQLWAGDVGQNAIEEIDIILIGRNYGWRVYEGSQCTGLDPQLCAGGSNPINHTPPIYEYNHSNGRCSVTGGYVYRGIRRTFASGTYIYGDYCTGEIWIGGNSTPIIDTPRNISSFGEDDDGEIYVVGLGGTVDKIIRANASADFDGDARTDTAVFRPSEGVWYILNSSNNSFRAVQFGADGDIPTPEDFDGDYKTDIAVFRPSAGTFYILGSNGNIFFSVQWGSAGDIPTQADFDGDARADVAVFRPSEGVWYIRNSRDGSFRVQQFGISTDIPVAGDYNGDGRTDIAVFRKSTGTWYILSSQSNSFTAIQFGSSSDIPAQGDFDGDGKADISVFRESEGRWYRINSSNNSLAVIQFGSNADKPVVGDYDGDGRDDIAVWRAGFWYRLNSSNNSFSAIQFGISSDLPVPLYDVP